MRLLALPLALALLPLALRQTTSLAQQQDASGEAAIAAGLAERTPQVFFYNPTNADAAELLAVAQRLYGRQLLIIDDFGNHQADNLMQLGSDRLLIFDFPAEAQQILDLFAKLDTRTTQPADAPPERVTTEYRPGSLPLDDLATALLPFSESLPNGMSSITSMSDADLLVIRDTPARTQEMLELLERIDVPAPQVQLTCFVLQAADTPEGSDNMPAGLKEGLADLLPFYNFRTVTTGILRLSTTSNSNASLNMQLADDNASYVLDLRVSAYDAKTKSLSLTGLEARLHTFTGFTQLFRTDAALTGGEYAVMGAAGATPTFVVLRFEPLGK